MDEATRIQVQKTREASEKAAREALVVDPKVFELNDEDIIKKVDFSEQNRKTKEEVEERTTSYFLPNNETETNRLNMQHHIFALSFSNRLSLAPLPSDLEGKQILDIGTGTGIWAVDFATQHPKSHVTGFDITPPYPPSPPQNTTFLTHNAETTPWPFPPGNFHYIHARAMMSCFDSAELVIKEAFRCLEPGGWLELQDVIAPWTSLDESLTSSDLLKFHTLTIEGAKRVGRDVCQVIKYPSYMEKSGFEGVEEVNFQWPLSSWVEDGKMTRIGEMFRDDLDRTFEPISERLLGGVLKMSVEEREKLVEGARRDLWDVKRVRGYMAGLVVFGRKGEVEVEM